MKGSPEGRTLLSLLRASLSETFSDSVTVPSSLDWLMLKQLAHHHRIGPLLSYSLRRSRIHGIPDRLRSEWDTQRREAVATSLYHVQALEKLAELFDSRHLPFILLKGEALSQTCYPDEGLRPYGDIDLLIKEGSYEAAKAALVAYGFHLRHPHLETEKRELFGEVEFDLQGPRTLTVDLHWDTLMASWGPPSLLGETIAWDSSDQIRLGRRMVPVLGGETLVLYLCVHFAFHHVLDGLILLCDLFLILKRDGHRIDWDRFVQMAHRHRCRQAASYALSSAQSLLGADIPSQVMNRLRPAVAVRLLMPVDRLLLRDRAVPQLLERYVKFLLIDDQSDRWRTAQCWWRSSKPWLVKRSGPTIARL